MGDDVGGCVGSTDSRDSGRGAVVLRPKLPIARLPFVFVYGTLKRGYGNNAYLTRAIFLGPAEAEGFALLSLGFCPGMIPREGHTAKGELYDLSTCPDAIYNLDRIESEGDFYHRHVIEVLYGHGRTDAQTYIIDESFGARDVIPTGEWVRSW